MSNIILRPVFNRPEMLALSLEYEKKAREYYDFGDLETLFLVEYGADLKTKKLIKEYPFEAKYIVREKKFGLTINILEGMKAAFEITDNFIIHLEDDILLHETYFEYMAVLQALIGHDNYSVLSPYNPNNKGDVQEINKHNHYAALAPLISKKFFEIYVKPCANVDYYNNPPKFVAALNNMYKAHWESRRYKYTNTAHWEQAGLINRLVDVAIIEEKRYLYRPMINRHQHIGYFGKNRPGGIIPGGNYKERLANLREIILDADKMYKMSATKQYNDYQIFSPELKKWDGKLILKGYKGTCKDDR
jgi:hypothetical protein